MRKYNVGKYVAAEDVVGPSTILFTILLSIQLVTVLTIYSPLAMPSDFMSFFRSLRRRASSLFTSNPNEKDPLTEEKLTFIHRDVPAEHGVHLLSEESLLPRPTGFAANVKIKSRSQPNMRRFAFKSTLSALSTAHTIDPTSTPKLVPLDPRSLTMRPKTNIKVGGKVDDRPSPPWLQPHARRSSLPHPEPASLSPASFTSAPTPTFSYTTTYTPSTVSFPLTPEAPNGLCFPFSDTNDLYATGDLVKSSSSELDLGDLAKRRGFRGARLFTAAGHLRTLSTALSPLSPYFTSSPALRRISSMVWKSPHTTAPDTSDSDPFMMHGESYYGPSAEAGPFADVYDFSTFEHPVLKKVKRSLRSNDDDSSKTKPRERGKVKSRVNVYVVSMYDADIASSSPSQSKKLGAKEIPKTGNVAYERDSTARPEFPKDYHNRTASRASVVIVPEAEELLDKEYLRSIARAFFTPEVSPRTSISSIFSERRQSKGLRPLVLPQQLALAQDSAGSMRSAIGGSPCLSEPRNESDIRRSLQARVREARSSNQARNRTSVLDDTVARYSWDESMELEVMRLV
ncbi:hypothetical protein EW146_g8080 [Bondarzewia mesenterica]|uniref:Uncharacterized protein n=1 Tax=Bondarzewia mesenterica TaxID=1095465 RepID=A0A4S4LHG8_9AGAM|nr:hypothetical protein EW146_g8080 [Bondarzewia mesenterica]